MNSSEIPRAAPSVVLFDLDGTLTDSGPGILNSLRYAFAALDLPAPVAEQLRAFIGPPLHESFTALGIDPVIGIAKYREYFSETGIYENAVYPGIPSLLAGLQSSGVRLAVATSKATVFALRVLEHFELLPAFESVHGDELDGSRRHKQQVIAAALSALDIDGSAAVMVGDRAVDAVGATACGVPFIGAGWGYGEPGELSAAGATIVAATPRELGRLLAAGDDQGLGSEARQ